jgi:peroxiredoxin
MSTRMKETALSLKEQLAGSRAGWYRRVRAERHAIIRRHRAQAIVRVHLLRWPLLQPRTESVLSETAAAGASLVAISPEKPDDMLSTAEKNALTFEVPNDVGRALGLVYDFTDELKSAYRGFGLEIPVRNGAPREWALPVSATYVIDQDGETIYALTDVDYRDRADPSDVLKALIQRAATA